MDRVLLDAAALVRTRVIRGAIEPRDFREAWNRVPPGARDDWVNAVFGTDRLVPDGPELPRGAAPYLPCSALALADLLDRARVDSSDVFVDVGSGIGRALLLTRFLTGASVVGLEIQPELVAISRSLVRELNVERARVLEGEATELVRELASASVFFLYCPFGGARLEVFLDALEPLARTRALRVATLDLVLPQRPWLRPETSGRAESALWTSCLHEPRAR